MKFAKEYKRYMQGMKEELPTLGLKRLKQMIKKCNAIPYCPQLPGDDTTMVVTGHSQLRDESFFPSLSNELSAIVRCFNERVEKLLKLHVASTGLRKYFMWFTNRSLRTDEALVRQGKDLVTYAIVNAVAMRKITKKYDKKCCSKQGQSFRTEARRLHIEILESPWLHELMALYINLRWNKTVSMDLLVDLSLTFGDEDKPTLSCNLLDSMRVDIDLTCSICLDTVFDAVSLSCGHIFCYPCCSAAASVTVVDGLESADPGSKCPICRRAGVFPNAVRLNQLNILLRNSYPEYWEKRMQTERVERVRLAKEHWERQCRAFTSI
ncbi:hypothetical protein CFC21_110601 [Triticum aestivum]|uniref:RING-type E3 ubiquitin transferase n=2 Tax=Triticum aestivum TaxID=4565 RepID=A0A3B6TVQ3_WHEAT|nr:hypothetical protein CFC21_110601 [Triticum aestivum]